jgi:hypothetical protein
MGCLYHGWCEDGAVRDDPDTAALLLSGGGMLAYVSRRRSRSEVR